LEIPVTIETFGTQELSYPYRIVNTAGVGTHIVATLKEATVLKAGNQVLEYELSGVAEKEAYIMFDFIDINSLVQSHALANLIK
jgi:hypothetical protein